MKQLLLMIVAMMLVDALIIQMIKGKAVLRMLC